VNRTRAWLVVSPVIAAGVLVAHALAYRLTATPTDPFHEYLAHAPQVLLLLALSGLVLAGFGPRREAPPAWVFPLVGVATFVAQEHVERIVHGGGVPLGPASRGATPAAGAAREGWVGIERRWRPAPLSGHRTGVGPSGAATIRHSPP